MMLKNGAQWLVAKGLKAAKDRMVSTATKACDSFVAHPQSDKCGLIEIASHLRRPGHGRSV